MNKTNSGTPRCCAFRLRSLCCALLLAPLTCQGAWAADVVYPTKAIRLIVPYPPGGGVDGAARVIAQDLAPRLGQQLVIDNRGGAGGMVGIEIAAHSAPDGYTLLVGSTGLTSMPGLYKRLPFDPVKDFAPITVAVTGTYLLGVSPSLPVASVKDLIALAKKQPGRLNYGSAGAGSTIHLAGEMLRSMAHIDIVHVPYKGASAAMTDLIGGQIQMMFAPILAMLPQAKAGKLKALGVTSAKRSTIAPDIPTIAESGVPGYEVTGWYGLVAPAGTPRAIVTRISAETRKGLESAAMRERLKGQGLEPLAASPEESARFIKADIERWLRVIRAAGIKPE